MADHGYGLPLKCPKCAVRQYYGMLKIPGVKAVPCPNCGSALLATRKRRRRRGHDSGAEGELTRKS